MKAHRRAHPMLAIFEVEKRLLEMEVIMPYELTLLDKLGMILEQGIIDEAESPMEALRIYAEEKGWEPRWDSFDPIDEGVWQGTDVHGVTITVRDLHR